MDAKSDSSGNMSFPDECPDALKSTTAMHDPFEWYARKRRAGPVHYDPQRGVYDVFSFEHVKTALQDDDRLVRTPLSGGHRSAGTPFGYIDNAMVWSDGAEHSEVKSRLFNYFRPDLLETLRGTVKRIAADQLDAALADGPTFDFIEAFAVPVPLRIIMDVVGVPESDHERMFEWLETFREVMNTEYSAVGSSDESRMAPAVDYFDRLVDRRSADPQADLVSRLATETDLSNAEIGANCFDFILAGQGTMSEFLSNAVYLFATHDLVDSLDAYDLSSVLEEVLRYRTPLQSRARETTEAVRIHETTIPPSETVILWLGAANRDPERYEQSDRFVPDRDPDHLAFGNGPHTCIGAPLARLQAPIVLRTFFDRIDDLSVATEAMRPKPKPSKLGFDRLPVRVTPASR